MKPLRVSIIKTEQQDPEHGPCGVLAKNSCGPTESESLQNGSREATFSYVSRRIAHAQQGLSNTPEGEFPGVGGMMYGLQGFCFVCLFLRGRGQGVRDPLRGY